MTRLFFPACARNREPILAVLTKLLVESRRVLEVACGSGEHAAFFAPALPWLEWLPTDLESQHVESTLSWTEGIPNVRPAQLLDVVKDPWPEGVDTVFSANLVHIAPWQVTLALFQRCLEQLPPGGQLVTYGPYKILGETAASNLAFDASLKARNPEWGVREVADLAALGLRHEQTLAMPANNHLLVFRR